MEEVERTRDLVNLAGPEALREETEMRGIVVGSINMDLILRVPSVPRPGETCLGEDLRKVPGGKGANQAVALARLGVETSFIGCVGEDEFGGCLLEDLKRDGVDASCARQIPSVPSGVAVILLQEGGQNSIVVAPGANNSLTREHLQSHSASLAGASMVLVQLEIPLEAVEKVGQLARGAGVLSVLDAGPAREIGPSTISLFDVISPNETETEALVGLRPEDERSAREASKRIHGLGGRIVVLKMGARGAYFSSSTESGWVPAFQVSALDTTAAGDAFTAAWAVKRAEGASLEEATRYANAAGACAATVLGARPSMPFRAAVEGFLARGVRQTDAS